MKLRDAIILAAGEGRRMKGYTQDCPKPLLEVKEQSLMIRLLHLLGNESFDRIVIVTGYLAYQIQDEMSQHSDIPEVMLVHNEEYRQTGSAESLHRALKLLRSEQFVLIDADLFLSTSSIFDRIGQSAKDNVIVTTSDGNEKLPFDVREGERDEDGFAPIEQIGRDLEGAERAPIGLQAIGKRSTGRRIVEKLRNMSGRKRGEYDYLDILSEIFEEDEEPFQAFRLAPDEWVNVDTPSDLKQAEQLHETWKQRNKQQQQPEDDEQLDIQDPSEQDPDDVHFESV